jgi:hypothetical protein
MEFNASNSVVPAPNNDSWEYMVAILCRDLPFDNMVVVQQPNQHPDTDTLVSEWIQNKEALVCVDNIDSVPELKDVSKETIMNRIV